MSKSLELLAAAALGLALLTAPALAAGDAAKGETIFKRCKACHMVGEGAKNRVGPQLNDLFGRVAGTAEGFRYSKAMVAAGEAGMTWGAETLDTYLAKPRAVVKGTRMAFPGLRKESDRADVIAYLRNHSAGAGAGTTAGAAPAGAQAEQPAAAPADTQANDAPPPTHGSFHLGRAATAEEVAAWDIDIRPDGAGLPEGAGTVAEGEVIFTERCASCHGDFGEGRDRWPVLAGGFDTLTAERPVKTIGSYWPYLSTVFDYVRRAMPFGDARSLSDDEVYAITAYLLYLNDIVTDEEFELSKRNFASIKLPNEDSFVMDDRAEEAHYAQDAEPCMTDCKPEPARIVMRARVLDVTPESDQAEQGAGSVD